MQEPGIALVSGVIESTDRIVDWQEVTMRWVRLSDGETVHREVRITEDGRFPAEGELPLTVDEGYVIYIDERVGSPAAIVVEPEMEPLRILWSATSQNIPIDGRVKAYNGEDLGGVQRFLIRDNAGNNVFEGPTDNHGSYQETPIDCSIPDWLGDQELLLYINYGPGCFGPTGDSNEMYVPGVGLGPSTVYRRNSGTANVKLIPPGDYLMWRNEADTMDITPKRVPAFADPERRLISARALSGGTVYKVTYKEGDATWKQPKYWVDPNGVQHTTSTDPFRLPRRVGTGSDNIDFIK